MTKPARPRRKPTAAAKTAQAKTAKTKIPAPAAKRPAAGYINREQSWVEFNARVLSEAENPRVPLLERLKFISIVSSNFDEFFMVRVASVLREARRGDLVSCPSGQKPSEIVTALMARIHELVATQYRVLTELETALHDRGVNLMHGPESWNTNQREYLGNCFQREIFPTLTPVALPPGNPFPFTGNLRLHAAFLLSETETETGTKGEHKYAIVQIPASLDRVWQLPETYDRAKRFVLIEDIIRAFADRLFPGYEVEEFASFRVTRDADVAVDEDDDVDFMIAMEEVVSSRESSRPVRVQLSTTSDRLRTFLIDGLEARQAEIFNVDGPLELKSFIGLGRTVADETLVEPDWPPLQSPDLMQDVSLWDVLKKRDILLHHPYQSFDPVVDMIREAADDPRTLAIKMTLYRTSGRSPIVRALARAAENGKQVTALVELKARFDEERNISWARQLEQAGVIVIYGLARLKVHSKAVMIVRREDEGVCRYAHLGTGNYNDATARLYTDMGLMTARDEFTYEVARFFNAITGHTTTPNLRHLVMAPLDLRDHVKMLIQREMELHSADKPGRIIAKMNSLVDPELIGLIQQAAAKGVSIRLNIRGICCLRLGKTKASRNIEIVSVIDRFLEHTRLFYFANGGQEEIYLSSADWMPRNLDQRVELMFPILQPDLRQQAKDALDLYFRDTVSAHRMQPDGSYQRITPEPGAQPCRSQEEFYQALRAEARAAEAPPTRDFVVRRKPVKPRIRKKS